MKIFEKFKEWILPTPPEPDIPPLEAFIAKREHDARITELRSAIASRKAFHARVDEVTDTLKDALGERNDQKEKSHQ